MLTEARPSVPPIRPPEERVDEPAPTGGEPQSVGDGQAGERSRERQHGQPSRARVALLVLSSRAW